MKLLIESVHFTADRKLLDYIEQKLSKLDTLFDRILDVTVYLKLENSGQVRDKIVELVLNVPKERLVCKAANKSFESATVEALELAKRQLVKYKELMRETS